MKYYVGIDPSTKTGIVKLDENGAIIFAELITSEAEDPWRISDIMHKVNDCITSSDIVAMEGFGFASSSGFILGGIGWAIRRHLLVERGIKYYEAAPNALKKFVAGKGTQKKDELAVEIYKRWGFEHKSDDVRDAYVMAQIARSINTGITQTVFQAEVIKVILGEKVVKKKKGKSSSRRVT